MTYASLEVELKASYPAGMREIRCLFQLILRTIPDLRQAAGFVYTGVAFKAIFGVRYLRFSVGLYLALGWVALIAAKPLWLLMPAAGLIWLLSGGIAYTAGVAFFAAHRVRYNHFVWHLFVLAGTARHFIAVLRYAA